VPVFDQVPVLCGHRGVGRGPGENTLGSFREAVAQGLPWVEVDVRLSADRALVAWHDPTLPDGRRVSKLTAAESGLMRLDELFEELPAEIGIDLDVKPGSRWANRALASRVADLAHSRARTLVTSFDPALLPLVRKRAPDVPIGLLTWRRVPARSAIAAAVRLRAEVVAPAAGSLRADPAPAVAAAHAAGLQVLAWDVQPEDVDPLSAAGVDCLCLD
jgi:glycerophosphoryl diester phosphodiesterase